MKAGRGQHGGENARKHVFIEYENCAPNPKSLPQSEVVLLSCQMSHTLTIRLTEELLSWLKEMSRKTGLPVGRIIRQQLESARCEKRDRRFLRHAGKINGPPDLSLRKGFSRR